MSKWEMVRLGDVCEKRIDTLPTGFDEKIIYIDISSVDNLSKEITTFQEIYGTEAPSRAKQLLKKNDVIVSTVRPNLNAVALNYLESTCLVVASTGYCVLRCKSMTDARYIYYFCQSERFVSTLVKVAKGASYPAVSNNDVKNVEIPLPPLDEQKRIAKNLDLASEIFKGYKEQLAELDKLIQSVFYEMFGDPVTNEKGWKIQALQSVCDVRDGTHDSPVYVEDGYPLVTSKNVSQGFIDFSTANLISQEDLIKINQRSKVDAGDIIMPMIGTIGNPVIVNVDREFAVKNVAIIKFAGSIMCNTFIKTLLSSSFFDNAIQKANRGGTQKFIALGDIRKLSIPIPPSDVQTRFASIVTEIEAQKAQVQQALTEAENLFNSLMQEYFE